MKILTASRAALLKAHGIENVASICGQTYNTRYYKLESIDTILANGGKMPKYHVYNGFIHGINGRHIDWEKAVRWNDIDQFDPEVIAARKAERERVEEGIARIKAKYGWN